MFFAVIFFFFANLNEFVFTEKENRNILLKPTVPHSPKLMTKSRIRSVENMTTEDQQK